MVRLLKQMTMSTHTWYAIIILANTFFLIPRRSLQKTVKASDKLSCAISGLCPLSIPTSLSRMQGSPTPFPPQGITLVHYTDGITLISKMYPLLQASYKTFVCHKKRNKSNENSEAFHLSEISMGQ